MNSGPAQPRRVAAGVIAATAVLGPTALARAQGSATPALVGAIRRNDPHALRTALLRGADANSVDENGEPVVVLAARTQSWEALRALAELRGTRLDATDRSGADALMYVSLHGQLELARFLVERKAEVNRTGWTALHFAAANGHADVVRFLLEKHAYIDAESPNGTTPLMMAARQAHPTTVRLLVDEGADPTLRNQAGLDAAAYARAAGDAPQAEWLAGQAEAFRRRYGREPARR